MKHVPNFVQCTYFITSFPGPTSPGSKASASLGPRPKTTPSADRFQYCALYWKQYVGLGTRLGFHMWKYDYMNWDHFFFFFFFCTTFLFNCDHLHVKYVRILVWTKWWCFWLLICIYVYSFWPGVDCSCCCFAVRRWSRKLFFTYSREGGRLCSCW